MTEVLRQARQILLDDGWRAGVYAVVCCIPSGCVLGYRDVGVLLGRPRAARQVGYALAALEPGRDVPWWRVTRSNGTIAMQGDPSRGLLQAQLLRGEGVTVSDRGRLDIRVARWEAPLLDASG
ncbi:MAG: MGMT family protein [Myxococcota bacterium]|nr:MGMT family protein [Myxococcota bacterium]